MHDQLQYQSISRLFVWRSPVVFSLGTLQAHREALDSMISPGTAHPENLLATLPAGSRPSPVRPCVPITIRSA